MQHRVARRFVADFQETRKNILEWVDSYGDPLTLYRAVKLPRLEDLDTSKLGQFWTPIKSKANSAHCHGGGEGEVFILEAKVNREDVDEFETVATMRRYPSVQAIRPRAGAPIQLLGVHTKGGFIPILKRAKA